MTKKCAHEIPDDFGITDEMRTWANEKVGGLDLDNETDKFCAYYRANAKKFVRWDQAWRNWLLKAVEFQTPRSGGTGASGTSNAQERRSNLTEAVLARRRPK